MSLIRWVLGRLILLIDWLTSPRGMRRPPEEQALLDSQTAGLSLYQYQACPFCVKVRRAIRRYSLRIETRDAKRNPQFREELREQGGLLKVPCLRIEETAGEVRWLYESSDIIRYLEQRYIAGS